MATKGKDVTLGKEKRGTSPSNLHRQVDPANRKRSPKLQSSSQPSSPDKNSNATTTQSSGKQVPNYLRPTISSRVDQPSLKYVVKKNGPEDHVTTKKPSLSRRNSFDKPPSPSRVQKPLVSASFRERTSIHPPTPVSQKPSTSKKPISEKPITKTQTKSVYKVVRSQPSSPVLKSKITNRTIKSNDTTNDINVIHDALNAEESAKQEVEEKEESLMNDVEEELVKVESGVELFPPDISIPPETKQFVDATTDDDLKTHEDDEKLKPCDISTVSEDQEITPPPTEDIITKTHGEEVADVVHHDEDDKKQREQDLPVEVEMEESSPVAQPKVETETINKEGEEGSSTDQRTNFEESEEVKDEKVAEEAKEAAKNVQVVKRPGPNKKDNSPAYNDVIEETASKLLEKRKNKVRALVGAFETVISLQEPEA